MSNDKRQALIDEHGFKPENVPAANSECLDRVYEAIANDDGTGEGGEGATESEQDDETPDGPDGEGEDEDEQEQEDDTAGADDETVARAQELVNDLEGALGEHDSFDEAIDARVEQRLAANSEQREKEKRVDQIIANSNEYDGGDKEELLETPETVLSSIERSASRTPVMPAATGGMEANTDDDLDEFDTGVLD